MLIHRKIIQYVIYDIVQNKIVLGYALFLFLASWGLFGLESNSNRALMSLLNIVLVVLPLVSLIFATIHFYNSYEFTELLLAQPLARRKILLSEYVGVSLSLLLAVGLGMGIPIMLFVPSQTAVVLLFVAFSLTLVFVSLAFLGAVLTPNKAKGIGISLLIWFYFALLYDGIVLWILFAFRDYPLERIMMILASLNPVDLGRIMMLLEMDISALMGYTGAIYKEFLGSTVGLAYMAGVMAIWAIMPLLLALRIFDRKDL
jgi:Cu-processing system permease protein